MDRQDQIQHCGEHDTPAELTFPPAEAKRRIFFAFGRAVPNLVDRLLEVEGGARNTVIVSLQFDDIMNHELRHCAGKTPAQLRETMRAVHEKAYRLYASILHVSDGEAYLKHPPALPPAPEPEPMPSAEEGVPLVMSQQELVGKLMEMGLDQGDTGAGTCLALARYMARKQFRKMTAAKKFGKPEYLDYQVGDIVQLRGNARVEQVGIYGFRDTCYTARSMARRDRDNKFIEGYVLQEHTTELDGGDMIQLSFALLELGLVTAEHAAREAPLMTAAHAPLAAPVPAAAAAPTAAAAVASAPPTDFVSAPPLSDHTRRYLEDVERLRMDRSVALAVLEDEGGDDEHGLNHSRALWALKEQVRVAEEKARREAREEGARLDREDYEAAEAERRRQREEAAAAREAAEVERRRQQQGAAASRNLARRLQQEDVAAEQERSKQQREQERAERERQRRQEARGAAASTAPSEHRHKYLKDAGNYQFDEASAMELLHDCGGDDKAALARVKKIWGRQNRERNKKGATRTGHLDWYLGQAHQKYGYGRDAAILMLDEFGGDREKGDSHIEALERMKRLAQKPDAKVAAGGFNKTGVLNTTGVSAAGQGGGAAGPAPAKPDSSAPAAGARVRDRTRAAVIHHYGTILEERHFDGVWNVAERPRVDLTPGYAVTVEIPPIGAISGLRPGVYLDVVVERDADTLEILAVAAKVGGLQCPDIRVSDYVDPEPEQRGVVGGSSSVPGAGAHALDRPRKVVRLVHSMVVDERYFGKLVHVAEIGWPRDAPLARGHAVTVEMPARGACRDLLAGSHLNIIAERDVDSSEIVSVDITVGGIQYRDFNVTDYIGV
jgi:hypothetical protein